MKKDFYLGFVLVFLFPILNLIYSYYAKLLFFENGAIYNKIFLIVSVVVFSLLFFVFFSFSFKYFCEYFFNKGQKMFSFFSIVYLIGIIYFDFVLGVLYSIISLFYLKEFFKFRKVSKKKK